MSVFKGFRCKYCGKPVSWNTDKGSRPPANANKFDKCTKSPDKRHHFEEV